MCVFKKGGLKFDATKIGDVMPNVCFFKVASSSQSVPVSGGLSSYHQAVANSFMKWIPNPSLATPASTATPQSPKSRAKAKQRKLSKVRPEPFVEIRN